MGIELKEPTLVQRVEALASKITQPAEQVLEAAVRAYLDELERRAIQTETQAFWAMHKELLHKYPRQHVALYQGQVVDHDEDAARLEKRVRERFRRRDNSKENEKKCLGGTWQKNLSPVFVKAIYSIAELEYLKR